MVYDIEKVIKSPSNLKSKVSKNESQLWMPITCTEIEKLEKIQRDYFRYIPALCGLNYWDQLNRINMISIQRRLERYRIIYSWKILENLVPNCGLEVVVNSAESRQGRRFTALRKWGGAHQTSNHLPKSHI